MKTFCWSFTNSCKRIICTQTFLRAFAVCLELWGTTSVVKCPSFVFSNFDGMPFPNWSFGAVVNVFEQFVCPGRSTAPPPAITGPMKPDQQQGWVNSLKDGALAKKVYAAMSNISAVKEIMAYVNLLDLLVYQLSVLPAQSVYSNSNSLKGEVYCKICRQP